MRKIEEMTFGMNPDPTDPSQVQVPDAAVAANVRQILQLCGCVTEEDVANLGCTGLAAHDVKFQDHPLSIVALGEFLRRGLTGSGVGLTCFVPPTRYCLIHETVGGLQEGQGQRYPEHVASISRELTDKERGAMALTDAARRMQGKTLTERLLNTADVLGGRAELPGEAAVEDPDDEHADTCPAPATGAVFTCPEHPEFTYACRFCVAGEIVKGPFEPTFNVISDVLNQGPTIKHTLSPPVLEQALITENRPEVASVDVYVRVHRYTRKLARE